VCIDGDYGPNKNASKTKNKQSLLRECWKIACYLWRVTIISASGENRVSWWWPYGRSVRWRNIRINTRWCKWLVSFRQACVTAAKSRC
jgi:hypothetical protein